MENIVVGMLARNEAWVIGMTARAVLKWCDRLIVLDHASTDTTRDIICQISTEHQGRVTILREDSPVWEEMRHRMRMLSTARNLRATTFLTVDADELLTANLLPRIRQIISQIPKTGLLQLPWVCMARGLAKYYGSGIWYNNWVSVGFHDSPELYWAARSGYDFHHRQPMGRALNNFRPIQQHIANHQGGLMHLQFVSDRRLKAKQYLYQLTERLRWPNRESVEVTVKRYQPAVYQSDPNTVRTLPAPLEWFQGYEGLMQYFHPDSEPWQVQEIEQLLIHRPELSAGLDGFGEWGPAYVPPKQPSGGRWVGQMYIPV